MPKRSAHASATPKRARLSSFSNEETIDFLKIMIEVNPSQFSSQRTGWEEGEDCILNFTELFSRREAERETQKQENRTEASREVSESAK